MNYYLIQPDGSRVQALGWQDLQNALLNGTPIVDDTGFMYDNGINPGSVISVAGGYLMKGCPLNVLWGVPMSLAQAQVLVQNAPILSRYPTCLNTAKAMVASATPSAAPTPTGVSNAPGPTAVPSGGSGGGGGGGYTSAAVATATAPSIPNALPTGVGSQVGGTTLTSLYRFILAVGGGYATGANRQGCSQTNSAMCDPQFFNSLKDAIDYALTNGEIPYKVLTANDPWALMAGTMAINPAQIYNADGSLGSEGLFGIPWWILIAGAAGAYILTR